jgi:hypothetical protein
MYSPGCRSVRAGTAGPAGHRLHGPAQVGPFIAPPGLRAATLADWRIKEADLKWTRDRLPRPEW